MLTREFSLPRNFIGILPRCFGESRRNEANLLKLKVESGRLVRRISPILNYPGPRFSADTNNRKINVCINIARELLTRHTLEPRRAFIVLGLFCLPGGDKFYRLISARVAPTFSSCIFKRMESGILSGILSHFQLARKKKKEIRRRLKR